MKQKLHDNPFVFHLNEMTKLCRGPDRLRRSKEHITPAKRRGRLCSSHPMKPQYVTELKFYNQRDEITPNILPGGATEKNMRGLLLFSITVFERELDEESCTKITSPG